MILYLNQDSKYYILKTEGLNGGLKISKSANTKEQVIDYVIGVAKRENREIHIVE